LLAVTGNRELACVITPRRKGAKKEKLPRRVSRHWPSAKQFFKSALQGLETRNMMRVPN
jgi:hypothetical protein